MAVIAPNQIVLAASGGGRGCRMAGKRVLNAVIMLVLVMGTQVQASPPLAPRRALPAVAMAAAGGSPTSGGGVKPTTAVVLETKSAGN